MPKISLTEKLKALYLKQDTLPKLIEDASVPEQRMDDYYVKLQIILDDKKSAIEKPPIKISKIFDPAGDQGAVGKVIIVGIAGAGKTTLLNHITYEWCHDRIYNEKFDYIFKVKLKNLANKHMVNELSRCDRKNILPTLIQRSFEQQLIEQIDRNKESNVEGIPADQFREMLISLEEIRAINKDKVVLLLDGYDEIEHLNKGGHIVRELMNLILEYPNIVVTSRPNALSSVLESRFERKIENIGIGFDGAREYLEKYFRAQSFNIIDKIEKLEKTSLLIRSLSDLQEQLRISNKDLYSYVELILPEFYGTIEQFKQALEQYHIGVEGGLLELYRQNPNLREVLATPINAAMICMITTDPGVQGEPGILDKFKNDFNIGQLYQSTVDWLSVRYLMKFEAKDRIDITKNKISNLDHLKVLKYVAHEKFKTNEVFISGKYIDEIILDEAERLDLIDKGLGIRQINKVGLLKAANFALNFELKLHGRGIIEDEQIGYNKISLYLYQETLSYALFGREGVERFNINEFSGLSKDNIQNIKASLLSQKQRLTDEDAKKLTEYIESKSGYIIYQKQQQVSKQMIGEVDERDLLHRKHAFIHSSFQEYLTAYKLKELLTYSDTKIYTQAAQFIGEHRNEPRYLLTLKFLSGIVTHSDNILLVQRFWEAVTCNVDGVIELGLNTKVTLLMHLLSQTKINNELDNRIANIDKLKELIDVVAINDIGSFSDQIIASGYSSKAITESILALLDLNYAWKIEYLSELLVQQKGSGKNVKINEIARIVLEKIANSFDQGEDLRKLAIEKLKQNGIEIYQYIVTQGTKAKVVKNIDKNINLEEQKEKIAILHRNELKTAIKLALKFVSIGKISSKELLDKLLVIISNPNWQIKLIAIESMNELIATKDRLLGFNLDLAKELIGKLQWHITDDNLKLEVFSIFKLMIAALGEQQDINELDNFFKNIFIAQLQIFHKSKKIEEFSLPFPNLNSFESLNQDILNGVVEQLKNTNWLQKYNAMILLNEVIQRDSSLISQDIVIKLINNLNDEVFSDIAAECLGNLVLKETNVDIIAQINKLFSKGNNIALIISKILRYIADKKLELINEQMTGNLLEKLSDSDEDVRKAVAQTLGAIAGQRPELINEQMAVSLLEKLSHSDSNVRKVVAKTFGAIAEKRPELINEQMTSKFIEKLSNSKWRVRAAVAETFGAIAEKRPGLINEQVTSKLIEKLSDINKDVREAVAETIGAIAEKRQELINEQMAVSLLEKLSDSDANVRKAVARTLGAIVEKRQELINEQMTSKFIEKVSNSEWRVRAAVAQALGAIAEKRPELINMASLLEELSDINENVRYAAAKTLGAIANKRPELINIASFIEELSDSDEDVREAVADTLGFIAHERPGLINEQVTSKLIEKLSDINKDVRKAVTETLGFIAHERPELINEQMTSKLIEKLSDSEWPVRKAVDKILIDIVEERPDLVNEQMAVSLLEKLSDSDSNVRKVVAKTFGAIAEKRPELINMASLLEKLSDSSSYARSAVARTFGAIADKKPDLINIASFLEKLSSDEDDIKAVAQTLGAIAGQRPELISEQMAGSLLKKLSNSDEDIRKAVAIALGVIADKRPELISEQVTSRLIEKLSDSNKWQVIPVVARTLGAIADKRPDLISEQMAGSLLEKLSHSDFYIRSDVAIALGVIAEKRPELINEQMTSKFIEKLNDSGWSVREAVTQALGVIAEKRPELINMASLLEKLSDSDKDVREPVAIALGVIADKRPDLISEQMASSLLEKLSDNNKWQFNPVVAKTFGAIAEKRPELINEQMTSKFIEKLSDSSSITRSAVAQALGAIAEKRPDLINIASLLEKLSDINKDVREAVAIALGVIADKRPELINEQVTSRLIEKLSDSNKWEVVPVVARTLGAIADKRPDLISEQMAVGLLEKLSHSDSNVREVVAKTFGAIAEKRPELINEQMTSKFIEKLSNSEWPVRKAVAETLRAIAEKRPELINMASFLEKLSKSKWQVRAAVAETFGAIAEKRPDLINEQMAVSLLEKLSDSDSNVRKAVARTLGAIAEKRPDLIIEQMAGSFLEKLSDINKDVREAVAENLGAIAEKRPDLISEQVTSKLIEKLSDSEWQVGAAVAKTLGAIAEKRPDLISEQVTSKLIEKLSDSEWPVRKAVAETLRAIAEKRPELISEQVTSKFIEKLSDSEWPVRKADAIALGVIAEKRPDLISEQMPGSLLEKLSDINKDVREAVAETLGFIAEKRPDLINIASLLKKLSDSNEGVRSAVSKILISIITSLSAIAIKIIDHPVKAARDLAIQVLSAVLYNQDEQKKISIDVLLAIIAFHDPKDREKKRLIELAKKVLDQKIPLIQDDDVEHITQNYDELLALSSESTAFLDKVYAQVISNGKITAIEKDFIIKSIENGIATSFTKDEKIIFNGKSHDVDVESKFYLEEIVRASLGQKDDILVKQYNEYQPIFENHQAGMRLAANDITEVVSLVNPENKLNNHEWLLSLMHLSDHKKNSPKDVFAILERRNEFGSYEIYIVKGNKAELESNKDKSLVHSIKYPTELDTEFRKEVFGKINLAYDESINYKPRYYVSSVVISFSKALELLKSSTGQDQFYDWLHKFIGDIDVDLQNINSPWDDYVYGKDVIEYKATDLLALSEGVEEWNWARQHSFNIWSKESIEDLNSFKEKFKNINIDSLTNILDREEQDKNNKALLESFDNYQKAFYRTIIMQLNAMYVATSAINSQIIDASSTGYLGLTGKIGGLLQSISSHIPIIGPGVQMLGAIMSQVDLNDRVTGISNYANFVTSSGEMEKIAIKIAIYLAKHSHKLSIVKIVDISDDNYNLAQEGLALAPDDSVDSANKLLNYIGKINLNSVVDSAGTLFDNLDLVTLSANVISGIKSRITEVKAYRQEKSETTTTTKYIELFLFGVPESEEDKEANDGAEKGKKLAAFIIEKIFSGVIKAVDTNTAGSAKEIIDFLSDRFDIPNIDAKAIALDNNLSTSETTVQKIITKNGKNAFNNKIHPELESEVATKNSICIVSYAKINYDISIINHQFLLNQVVKTAGPEALNQLINLAEDAEVSEAIVVGMKQYGVSHILEILFSPVKNNLLQIKHDSLGEEPSQLSYSHDNLIDQSLKQQPYQFMANFVLLTNCLAELVARLQMLDINCYIKKIYFAAEISHFNDLLAKNNIKLSIEVLSNPSEFRKQILLKLHPDKGGNNEDFILAKTLQEKITADLNIEQILSDHIKLAQAFIHQISGGFKLLDGIVDASRLIYQPSYSNTKAVIVDAAHLYGIYQGFNGISIAISAIDVSYKLYQDKYQEAVIQGSSSLAFMALPLMMKGVLKYTSADGTDNQYSGSLISLAYGMAITAYSGYSAIKNAYSLYKELGSDHLNSFTAYQDITKILSQNSFMQSIYDFKSSAIGYGIKINQIKLALELAQTQKTLIESKGEFGSKLFAYIYKPYLEEKYDLLNKFVARDISEEQKPELSKHISLRGNEVSYDHCMEVKGLNKQKQQKVTDESFNDGTQANTENYCCYNYNEQVLDHVLLITLNGTINSVEIVEHL